VSQTEACACGSKLLQGTAVVCRPMCIYVYSSGPMVTQTNMTLRVIPVVCGEHRNWRGRGLGHHYFLGGFTVYGHESCPGEK